MSGDDVTLALIELRVASARDRHREVLADLSRREARRQRRRSRPPRPWRTALRRAAAGVPVWTDPPGHTLSRDRVGDRPRA